MFTRKKIQEETVEVENIRQTQERYLTTDRDRDRNFSRLLETYTLTFKRPDETLISFSVSEKQAQAFQKGMHGTLRYKGSKFISFTQNN